MILLPIAPTRVPHPPLGMVGSVAAEAAAPLPSRAPQRDLRALGGLMAAGALVLPVLPDVGPLCPLRRVTGVPCPFCGMTTGVLALARGDVVAAVSANPAAPLLVLAVALAFLPFVYRSAPFRRATARTKPLLRVVPWILLPLLWVWELHRFDHI